MSDAYLREVFNYAQRNHSLKQTVSGIAYQTGYAAAGAGAGGLLAGPLGAMFGTLAGAVYGYAVSDNYASAFGILGTLGDEEKDSLAGGIKSIVGGLTFNEFVKWFQDLDHQTMFMQLLMTYMAGSRNKSTRR
ncbi:unnamed protein product [Caenorhabditis sp. 36 PRJEB53466]|nr:unnamed protein product [Caenorhabditis sp. 36 PRJEB53466]